MQENVFKKIDKIQLKSLYIDFKNIHKNESRKTNSFLILLNTIEFDESYNSERSKLEFLGDLLIEEIIERYFNSRFN